MRLKLALVPILLCLSSPAMALTPGDALVTGDTIDSTTGGVVSFSAETGAPTVLAQGGMLSQPTAVLVEPEGTVLVAQVAGSEFQLVRLDPVTGEQSLLTLFGFSVVPLDLALAPSGEVLVAATAPVGSLLGGQILAVDRVTGDRRTVVAPALGIFDNIAVSPDGEVFLTKPSDERIFQLDLATGAVVPVLPAGFGYPQALAVIPDGGLFAVFAKWISPLGVTEYRLYRVDPLTGTAVHLISDPALRLTNGMGLAPDGTLLVGAGGHLTPQIVRIDPVAGELSILAQAASITELVDLTVIPGLPVEIDVLPGQDPNVVHLLHPRIPVAILGSEALDVADVDRATLAFGPDGAPSSGPAVEYDVNRDDHQDLVVWFRTRDTGLTSASEEACLEGDLASGGAFVACAPVEVRDRACGLGAELALLLTLVVALRRAVSGRR